MFPVLFTCRVTPEGGPDVNVRRHAMLPMAPFENMTIWGLIGREAGRDSYEIYIDMNSVGIDMETGWIVIDLGDDDYSEDADPENPRYTFSYLFDQPGMYYHGWEHFDHLIHTPFGDGYVQGDLILRPGNLPALALRRGLYGVLHHYKRIESAEV